MLKRVICILLALNAAVLCTGCRNGSIGETASDTVDVTVPTPSPSETISPSPVGTIIPTPYDRAAEVLNSLSLEQKAAQLFIIRPEQIAGTAGKNHVTPEVKAALSAAEPGGVAFFAENITGGNELKEYTSYLRNECSFMPFICVDEEGGSVSRLADSPYLDIPNVGSMNKIGNSADENKAFEAGQTIGRYLSEYGFNLDFAPVADVNTNPKNPVIGARAFSSDAEVVAKMTREFAKGLRSCGVLSVFKHFPGHGDTSGDTHTGYAESRKTLDELYLCELIPFMKNTEYADMIMVAHITLPSVTDDGLPATLSHTIVTGLLREGLNYDGVIITDALDMGAITKHYSSKEAAYLAFSAGCDMLLMPDNYEEALYGIIDAVNDGRITEERLNESVLRILRLKCSIHT